MCSYLIIIQGRVGLPLFPQCLDKDPQFLPLLISGKHVFCLSPTIQGYWQQLAKISPRKDNKFNVVKMELCLPLVVFPPLVVMLWISTISALAYTCSCVIPINMLYANSELCQGQIQNDSM